MGHYHLNLEEHICLLKKKHDFVKFPGVDMRELLNIEAGCVKTSRVLFSIQISGIFPESLCRSFMYLHTFIKSDSLSMNLHLQHVNITVEM